MRYHLHICVFALVTLALVGCTAHKNRHGSYSPPSQESASAVGGESYAQQRFRHSFEVALDQRVEDGAPIPRNREDVNRFLLRRARSAIGSPYVPGGMEPGGFDCSGLVCWTYKSLGVKLPRTAREQSVIGRRITRVPDMQVGDIVAFRHPRRGYHTGIYVGDGKFIHSPHRRSRVRVSSLDDPYFKDTFLGARRIKVDGSPNLVAEAENRLRDFAEAKAVRELSRKHAKARSERNATASRHHRQLASNDRHHGRRDHVTAQRGKRGRGDVQARHAQSTKDVRAQRRESRRNAVQQASRSDRSRQPKASGSRSGKGSDTASRNNGHKRRKNKS